MANAALKIVTDEIKIEKGVSPPPHRSQRRKYPWAEMEVGDSFLMPSHLKNNACYGTARDRNKEEILNGSTKRFKAGRSHDGFRVWRVA